MRKFLLIYFLLFYSGTEGIPDYSIEDKDFGYEGQRGPEHWADQYGQCNGKLQSPINIDDFFVMKRIYNGIIYEHFDEIPTEVQISNNKHTVVIHQTYANNRIPLVRGVPLVKKEVYQYEQLHFHWGINNTIGSEDHINGKIYPVELHVVFRSTHYKSFEEASMHHYGILVLACFFELRDGSNSFYTEFTNSLKSIIEPNTVTSLAPPLPSLFDIMQTDLNNYYTYIGSLTTPPCTEYVVWIDFLRPIYTTSEMVANLRNLKSSENTYLTHNFRPIQDMNNRIIFKVSSDGGTFFITPTIFYLNTLSIFVTLLMKMKFHSI